MNERWSATERIVTRYGHINWLFPSSPRLLRLCGLPKQRDPGSAMLRYDLWADYDHLLMITEHGRLLNVTIRQDVSVV